MMLALATELTERVALSAGVLVPILRHTIVKASTAAARG